MAPKAPGNAGNAAGGNAAGGNAAGNPVANPAGKALPAPAPPPANPAAPVPEFRGEIHRAMAAAEEARLTGNPPA